MSAYARGNTGQHYNDFDNGIRDAQQNTPKGFAPLQTITNYEVGFKFQVPKAYLDVTAYHRKFTGLGYQQSTITGTPLGIFSTFGATTKGVDFIGYVTPLQGLTLRVVGDYMDGKYENNNSCLQFTDVFGNTSCIFVNGAPLQRQPKFQIRATPSYTLPGSWGDVTAWLTYEHVGERYEDQSGRAPLGAYNMLGAGILANVGKNWQLRVQGTNLTNEIALTEGNARVFGGAVGIGGTTLVRPYEGKEISFTAYYKF
jgi:outer membrane receptor protein involved in Fe transport